MFRRFRKVCLTGQEDASAVWGTYEVHKRHVTVRAQQSWQFVKIDLTIQPNTMHGRFGYLSFDAHMTSQSGSFDDWSHDRVVYDVPSEPFRFVRDKRL